MKVMMRLRGHNTPLVYRDACTQAEFDALVQELHTSSRAQDWQTYVEQRQPNLARCYSLAKFQYELRLE